MRSDKGPSGCTIFLILNTFVLVVGILNSEEKTLQDYIILFVIAIIVAYIMYVNFGRNKNSE